jgi:HK97 family phage major capsid protein
VFEHLADEHRAAIARGVVQTWGNLGSVDLALGRARLQISDGVAYIVPAVRGGDDVGIDEAYQHVTKQLEDLAEKEAKGEEIDEGKKGQLEEQKSQLEELQGQGGSTAVATGFPARKTGETDEAYFKRFHEEVTERGEAAAMVKRVVLGIAEEEQGRQHRLKSYAADAIKEAFGGAPSLDAAVERVLQQHRAPSRFIGGDAEADAATAVAEGRGVIGDDKHLSVGGDRGIKVLQESTKKFPIGTYVALLNKRKFGVPNDAESRYFERLHAKALAEGTPSAGGILVPREYMQDLLGLLRAQTVVRRAGPRFQRFQREMYQTSVSSGSTAFYTQENAQIPISEPVFAEAPLLTPKNLTALVPASNYLLNDAEEAEAFVRQDLAEVMALREDLAFLRGTGTLGEPKGFRNIVGITLDPIAPGASGVQLTLAQVRRIFATFRSLNAGAVRPVFFFNPEFLTYLETLEEQSGGSPTGRTLVDASILTYDDDALTTGRINGVRFFSTTQLPNGTTGGNPTTELYLVNMAETIVGENQDLEIDLSREASYWDGSAWVSAFQNNQTVFRAVLRHDIAHRRPNQIIVQTGARTT